MRLSFRRLSPLALLAFVASAFAISCLSDPSGPSYQPGYLALAPSFESSASGVVDVDSIHVILVRDEDETVALDTVVPLTTDSDSVDLSFSVPVSSSSETFTLTLECLSPTGEVVFSAGPLQVTATTSGSDNVVAEDVPIAYVGVGSDAADINVPGDDIFYVHMSDTLTLEALALDSSGATIPGTPIKWTSGDTTIVRFPDPAVGRMEAGRIRGWVDVTAELLTGPTDIVEVYVEPVPSQITVVSGGGQTGLIDELLPDPVVIQVNAPDGSMSDVPIAFTTADGGTLNPAAALSDTEGRASALWTLGSASGTQTATAAATNWPAVNVSFTATAVTPQEPTLRFTVQPVSAAEGATITPPVLVTAYNELGAVDTDFTGSVAVTIATNPSNGALSGTRTVTANAGVAAFSNLSIDAAGTGYTLQAMANGYLSATSGGFNIGAAQGGQVAWTNANGGNWSEGTNWSTGAPPSASDTVVIVLPGEFLVTLDTDATVSVLVLGDGTNPQALTVGGVTLTVDDSLHVNQTADLTLTGTITGDGDIFIEGTMYWTAGAIGGFALLNIQSLGDFYISGANVKTLDRRQVVNYSAIRWQEGDLLLTNNASITIEPNAQMWALANGSISGAGTIQNLGFLEKNNPDSTVVQVLFDNGGVLILSDGYLVIDGPFSHQAGAMLEGKGVLDITGATISSFEGDVVPGITGGTLTVQGDLQLGSNSTVFLQINGLNFPGQYNRLDVTGDLGMAGTLDISVSPGFTPSLGNSFNVLGFETTSGRFANITGLDIGGGMELDTIWETTYLALDVVTATPAAGATISWTGAGDGTTWSDVANWSLNRVPNTTDTVAIALDGTYTVSVDAPTTVHALMVGGTTGTQTLSVASQTLTIDSAATFGANATLDMNSGIMNGTGTLTASAGASVILENSTISTPVTNNGTMVAHNRTNSITGTYVSGTGSILRVEGYAANNSTLTVADGFVNNGAIELTSNTTSRSSRLTVTNGTLLNPSGSTLDCLLGANSTTCYLEAELDNQGAMTVARQLYINKVGAAHTNSGTITLSGGAGLSLTLSSATFENSGTLDASTGSVIADQSGTDPSFTNSGILSIGSVYEVRINDGTFNYPSGTVNGPGILRLNRVAANIDAAIDNSTFEFIPYTVTVNGTGSITNAAGRTLTLTSSTVNIPVTNNGTLVAVAANTMSGAFINNGTVDVQTGPLTFSGDFTHADGAILQGDGTIDFTTTTVLGWDGDVNPGGADATGILNLLGSGFPSALSSSNVEIGGLTAGTGHDQVTVSGSFTANGTLNVSVINGFTPQLGQAFTVLTFADHTGEFSDTTGLSITGGLTFDLVWNATSLDLEVVDASPASPADIVFFSDSGGIDYGVYAATADGSTVTHVATTGVSASLLVSPKWSMDQRLVAYSHDGGGAGLNNLFLIDMVSGDSAEIVNDINTAYPQWSHNGSHLGFMCRSAVAGIDHVCVIPNLTTPITALTPNSYVVATAAFPAAWTTGPAAAAWDPVSQDRFIVARDSSGAATVSRFFSADYDGGNLNTITTDVMDVGGGPLRVEAMDLSSDGSVIVFSAFDTNDPFTPKLYVVNTDGTGLRKLTFQTGVDENPRFSPDGSEVMFGRDISCDFDYWIVDVNNTDGSLERQITSAEFYCEDNPEVTVGYDWSPDGSQIALIGSDQVTGYWRTYVVPSSVTLANYSTVRVLVGRNRADVGSWLREYQPSWRP